MDNVTTANQSACTSLCHPSNPGVFVRVYNGTCLEIDSDFGPRDPHTFEDDASFFLRSGEYFPDYITLEPVTRPDHRWIASGDQLKIDVVDNTEESQNKASFGSVDYSIMRTLLSTISDCSFTNHRCRHQ